MLREAVEAYRGGGTSVVHRARDVHLNRLVAIKVLPPEIGMLLDAAAEVRGL